MNNATMRYALNAALRGYTSLYYGTPSGLNGFFEIVPPGFSYYGVIGSGGPLVTMREISFIAADTLNLMQYGQIKAHGSLITELKEYEEVMGI